jgi:hypothetical protein
MGLVSSGFFGQHPSIEVYGDLRSALEIDADLINQAEERCSFGFETLERERLIIDPGFLVSPEWLVLLLGLVPMQWSVRT